MGSFLPKTVFAVEMTSQTIEYLDAYGKVWGFLKYTNPQLDSESWNQTLLNDYDKVKQITSDEEFSLIIDKLIKKGEGTPSSATNTTIAQSRSLEWMNITHLASYKERLQKIATLSKGKGGFTDISTREFTTEAERYWAWSVVWNVLNYEDTDLVLSTQQWHQMYSKRIPSFISSPDGDGIYQTLEQTIRELPMVQLEINDHAYHQKRRTKWASFTCIKIEGKIFIDQVYGTSVQKDIRRGDQIVSVNQQPAEKLLGKGKVVIKGPKKFYGNIKEVPQRLYLNNSPSELTIIRQGETISKTIHPAFTKGSYCDMPDQVNTELIPESSLYVKVATMEDQKLPNKFIRKYLSKSSVILDLRNIDKGDNQSIKEHFINEDKVYAKKGRFNPNQLGNIEYTSVSSHKMATEHYNGKLILLVDNTTSGELQELIMSLQANNNCTVIGRPIGKNIEGYSTFKLTDKIALQFPTEKRCYPNGKSVSPQGVDIDIMVPLTETYFKNVDEILYKALMMTKS